MTTDEIQQLVIQKAAEWGIDPGIALAQAQQESGLNPTRVGSSGERGLMQFMPGTWARFGSGSFDNAFDPSANLDAWGAYMDYLLGLFGNDYTQALTAYNGGEGHLTDPGKYGPPSAAAQAYGAQLAAQASYDVTGADSGAADSMTPSAVSGLPLWLILGGAALIAIIALRD